MRSSKMISLVVLAACGSHGTRPADSRATAPVLAPVTPTASAPDARIAGLAAVSVKDFGAKGDGVTDDRAAITAALAEVAKAGGGTVMFPPGVYVVGREGRAAWSLDLPCDHCTLVGVKGRSWLQHAKGLPPESIALMRVDRRSDVTIRDLGFDGNWGNRVGGTDSTAGINHATQGDPKNYLLMLRGVTDVAIENSDFRQAYGDCIWVGASTKNMLQPSTHVVVTDVSCDMAARDGIALGQAARDIHVTRSRFTNIFAQAFDTEPVNQGVEDVTIEDSLLDGWWNPGNPKRSVNSPLSIVGGNPTAGPSKLARHYRVRNNTIHGAVLIATAEDVVLDGNRIVTDWDGFSYSPITVRSVANDITITNNEIYARTHFSNGAATAGVSISYYAAGKTTWSPSTVRVVGNHIHAREGNLGIAVDGAGAHAGMRDAGTATALTITTLHDDKKHWDPGAWIGATVHAGGQIAIVSGNTANELQLVPVTFGIASAWMSPLGVASATPPAGAYALGWTTGTIEIADNVIDLAEEGDKPGGTGIALSASRPAGRVRVRGNTIRNATGGAIRVKQWDKARSFDLLELDDNQAFDDRIAPTTTSVVQLDSPVFASQLVMRGNVPGLGVAAVMSGVIPPWWAVDLGTPPRFAGRGSPEGTVPAAIGAIYQRVDAVGSAALFAKVSGSGPRGWEAVAAGSGSASAGAASSAPTPPWIAEHGLVGATADPALPLTGTATIPTGQVTLIDVAVYGDRITKVMFDVDQVPAGVTSVLVGLYREDGTQPAELARSTIDVVGLVTTRGVKDVPLAVPAMVTPGDRVIVAILPVGRAHGRALRLHAPATSAVLDTLDAARPQPDRAGPSGACCSDVTRLPPTLATTTPVARLPWIGLH